MPRTTRVASAAPTSCMRTNIGTDPGAIPANESDNMRAIVTAGLANEVDEVNQ